MSTICEKRQHEFLCECCDYKTQIRRDYNNHLLTKKHERNTDCQQKTTDDYICNICCKHYKDRTGLWRHSKKNKCSPVIEETQTIVPINTISTSHDLVVELLKQNNDLQRQIIELSKEPKTINHYNNMNTTNNNNQFNLNMFLNETCKDALNIDDFMDSLQLTVEDLEKTGELGFVQGITRIFLNGLKELEVSRRPIHCTDVKRETVYIKDQDKWEKESAEKTKMRQALNQAIRKNLGLIPAWREEHPDCLRSNTKDNDEYMKISMNSLGSEYEDEQERMNDKIIRNVLKEVVLDRKAGSQLSE
jgi:hypothetical protein